MGRLKQNKRSFRLGGSCFCEHHHKASRHCLRGSFDAELLQQRRHKRGLLSVERNQAGGLRRCCVQLCDYSREPPPLLKDIRPHQRTSSRRATLSADMQLSSPHRPTALEAASFGGPGIPDYPGSGGSVTNFLSYANAGDPVANHSTHFGNPIGVHWQLSITPALIMGSSSLSGQLQPIRTPGQCIADHGRAVRTFMRPIQGLNCWVASRGWKAAFRAIISCQLTPAFWA